MAMLIFSVSLLALSSFFVSAEYRHADGEKFETLVADIASLKLDHLKHESQTADIQARCCSRIGELEKQLSETNRRLDAAETKIHELEQIQDDMKTEPVDDSVVKSNNRNQEHHSEDIKRDGDHTTMGIKRMLVQPATKTVVPTSRIAFSAYLSAHVTDLGAQHPIPFDRVLINEGNAFDTVMHFFRCPVMGIYLFQSSLLSFNNEHVETEIVKDGSILAVMYAGAASTGNGYDQGFNSVITECEPGEDVWVRIHDHEGSSVAGSKYSMFMGYLLWEK